MRPALGCLLLAIGLSAQTTPDRLTATLQALKDPAASRTALSQRLAADLTTLAVADRQPSQVAITRFSDEFVRVLAGKDLGNAQIGILQRALTEMLRGSRANFNSATRLREILAAAGVDGRNTQVVVKRFLAIGEEV